MNKEKPIKCSDCIHYDLKINQDRWASSKPHPCTTCVYSLNTLTDNFIRKSAKQSKSNN